MNTRIPNGESSDAACEAAIMLKILTTLNISGAHFVTPGKANFSNRIQMEYGKRNVIPARLHHPRFFRTL